MIAEENKGKKKKFKEGQAEQVLDDLFFEAIKGVEILKPKFINI
jgi:DNA (cytosine-5)-methyltransferase 1